MRFSRVIIVSAAALIVLIGLRSCMFVVDETEQALITYLGKPSELILGDQGTGNLDAVVAAFAAKHPAVEGLTIKSGAGLYFKWPFLEDLVVFEDRLLEYDASPADIVTKDKKHLLVDNYLRWRIIDPLLFFQAVRTVNGAQSRLDDIMFSVLRETLAKNNLIEVVRSTNRDLEVMDKTQYEQILTGREKIMAEVAEKVHVKALALGIDVQDVRIKRADLPPENENAVFGRMIAERQRISKQYRSEGQEEASKIRSETDREVQELLAEATKESQTVRGAAEAKATAIYAAAYRDYADFYEFSRSLEIIKASMTSDTKLILGIDSGLFKALKGP